MKKMKKIIALAITLVMVVATMNMMTFAANATGAPVADSTITITGLDDGDTVNLYQVLYWDEGNGWRLTLNPDFTGLNNAKINKIIDAQNPSAVELTREDLEEIAAYAKTHNLTPASTTLSGTDTFTDTVDLGMYLALVTPAKSGVVYNPIIVSADHSATNKTNEIDASTAMMGSSSVAKKKVVEVDKREPKITNDIGDTYHFTIETTIPVYSKSFTDPFFKVYDEVTEYLDIQADTVVVTVDGTPITTPAPTVNDHDITLVFDKTYMEGLTAAQELVITYDAKLNISADEAAKLPNAVVQENKVTIDFPNDPKDDTSMTVLRDGTRERTFTIDGSLLGHEGWQNSELVKVAQNPDGTPIVSEISHSNGTKHAALDGATFGLYTSRETAEAGGDALAVYDADGNVTTDGLYHNDVFGGKVTSANGGLMYIQGLDTGTYYLKELTAPAGYIKDQDVHEVNIEVTKWKDVSVTEYYVVSGTGSSATVAWYPTQVAGSKPYTYTVKDVEEYTITIDGKETSYSMDLSGPYTSTSTIIKSSDAEIANTKGVELPSTGGIGTTLFYAIGAVLVLGAGILLVTRRRMAAK